jgi:hypothetical protein
MVCASTPRLGFEPKLCLARPLLLTALECFDRGDYIGCGVRLRESLSRFMTAMVDWYAVELPKSRKPLRPTQLAHALHKAKQFDKWALEIVLEMIAHGNTLAHCGHVDATELRCSVSLLFSFFDQEPCAGSQGRGELWNLPCCKSFDDYDDDDHGDDWKAGAV